MSATFKWGIIGPGRIAQKFAAAIPFSHNGILHAVASNDAGRAKAFAQQFGAKLWFQGYEAMLQAKEIDAVYVATPHPMHLEPVLLALQYKVPVLCEKPLALSARQVNIMWEASKTNQTFLMEGMWTRFLPHIIAAKQMIAEGIIGEPTIYQADFGIMIPFNAEGRHFNMALGGGAVIDIGIYPLFMGMYLFGQPEACQGFATKSPTGSDASLVLSMRFQHGVLGSIYASYQAHGRVVAEVAGTKGRLKLHSHWFRPSSIEVFDEKGQGKLYHFAEPSNGFQYEMNEVEQCVKAGAIESDAYPLAFSYQLAEVMDKLRHSFGVHYEGE
jgi:predicted dehydrogenase